MNNSTDNETKYFSLHKKIVGYKTYESWTTVPHVTFVYEADVTDFLAEFNEYKEQNPNAGITINTLLLKVCVEAIKAAPGVNAHIKYNPKYVTGQIEVIRDIDISIPWMLKSGDIVTINLRNFESKTLTEMQEYINKTAYKIQNCDIYIPMYHVSVSNMMGELRKGHLLKAVRALLGAVLGKSQTPKHSKKEMEAYNRIPAEDKITTQDLLPGTITISNIGSIYKEQKGFMGILEIVPPQIFAIGIGSIQEKAGVVKDKQVGKTIGIRQMIPMCLAFDHRALNFGEIVPFIQKLDAIFERAELMNEW